MKVFAKILVLGAAIAASAPFASATPITGSVAFSGAGTYSTSTGVFSPAPASPAPNASVGFGGAGTGSLSPFTVGTLASFSGFTVSTLTTGTTLFTSTAGGTVLSFTFMPGGTVNGTPDATGQGVILMGILHETGFDDTMGTLTISGNGGAAVFTAGVNIAATPEPSSLLLLGSGLVGAAGVVFRKRSLV